MSVTRRDFTDKKNPRDADTSEGSTQGDESLRDQNIQPPARITTPVARIAPEVLEEFGVSRLQQLSGHVEDARRELIEGMKLVDRPDERDLHVQVGQLVCAIDDLREAMVKKAAQS
jgi:hypothetical protein